MAITQMTNNDEPRVEIRETFMKPTAEWPEGGYLREVGGTVEIATGYFATIYPDKPSPYWHGRAPAVILWDNPSVEEWHEFRQSERESK